MPGYNATSFGPRAILITNGGATFLLGNRAATGGEMLITAVAIAANVGTVTVQSFAGNLPVVGTPISIRGTSQSAGAFNVTNALVTATALDANGNGSVSFAVTGANLATVADGGMLRFNPQVTGEVAANGASIAGSPSIPRKRTVYAEAVFATIPTAATVALQAAMTNDDASFQTLGTVATVAAGAIGQNGATFDVTAPFLRFLVSGVSGTGSIAAAVSM